MGFSQQSVSFPEVSRAGRYLELVLGSLALVAVSGGGGLRGSGGSGRAAAGSRKRSACLDQT